MGKRGIKGEEGGETGCYVKKWGNVILKKEISKQMFCKLFEELGQFLGPNRSCKQLALAGPQGNQEWGVSTDEGNPVPRAISVAVTDSTASFLVALRAPLQLIQSERWKGKGEVREKEEKECQTAHLAVGSRQEVLKNSFLPRQPIET